MLSVLIYFLFNPSVSSQKVFRLYETMYHIRNNDPPRKSMREYSYDALGRVHHFDSFIFDTVTNRYTYSGRVDFEYYQDKLSRKVYLSNKLNPQGDYRYIEETWTYFDDCLLNATYQDFYNDYKGLISTEYRNEYDCEEVQWRAENGDIYTYGGIPSTIIRSKTDSSENEIYNYLDNETGEVYEIGRLTYYYDEQGRINNYYSSYTDWIYADSTSFKYSNFNDSLVSVIWYHQHTKDGSWKLVGRYDYIRKYEDQLVVQKKILDTTYDSWGTLTREYLHKYTYYCDGLLKTDTLIWDEGQLSRVREYEYLDAPDCIVDNRPDLIVFPNPSRGVVHIRSDELQFDDVRLSVIGMNGVILLERDYPRRLGRTEVSVDKLPAGMYYVHLQSSRNTLIQPVVVY